MHAKTNVITKISCYFECNVVTLKLRKEYSNFKHSDIKYTSLTPDKILNSMIYRTLFYVNIYESHKLLKTVRFFWPTLYILKIEMSRCSLACLTERCGGLSQQASRHLSGGVRYVVQCKWDRLTSDSGGRHAYGKGKGYNRARAANAMPNQNRARNFGLALIE